MPSTVQNGDKGPDVRLLQHLLRDLNYDVGPLDGDFGPRTEAALRQYQQDHQLFTIEDGVCGEATWASLEGQFGNLDGLRLEDSVGEYVEDAHGIWNSSMSAEDRIEALERAANEELAGAAGVPYVRFALDASVPPYALFDFTTWIAKIEPTPFAPENAAVLTAAEQARISGAVYHEARHAEQWFDIARLLAGLHGKDAAAIAAEMTVPDWVAELAVAKPIMECGTTEGPAGAWYESIYGSGAAERNAILGTLNDADPTNDRYDEYRRDLPEEADSWDTGGTVERRWREFIDGGNDPDRPNLRRGDFNDHWVGYLQQLLQYRGYYLGQQLDGDFGPITEEAVKAFQAAQPPLKVDGIVGKATWEALIP